MRRNCFRIFVYSAVILFIVGFFTSFLSVSAAYQPTDQEIQDIQNRVGLAQIPNLTQQQQDQLKAVCLGKYVNVSVDDRDAYLAMIQQAVQCTACGQLVVNHQIASFTQQSCDQIKTQTEGYAQHGAQQTNAANTASQYCANTCLQQPDLVPDQAALAQGKIQVIDAEKGQYDVVKTGLDNQMGATCGLPRPGLDGDMTVMKCCVVDYDHEDLAGQLVQTPKFGCAPGWTNGAIDLAKSFVGNYTAGARTVGKLLQGKFGDALKTSVEIIPGGSLVTSLFGKNKEDNGPFCLSHITEIVGGKVLRSTPGSAVQQVSSGLKKKPCREGALPAINGILTTDLSNDSCTCAYPEEVKDATGAYLIGQGLCDRYLAKSGDYEACKNCTNGIYTGIGCIGTDLPGITRSVLGFGVSIGGGLALLSVMYAAFVIQTSRGNPERIKKGREYLNSSLIGLMIIIFSVLILQVIGIDILRLPGFTR